MGLDIEMKTVFKQGPLFVIKLTPGISDMVTLVRSGKGDLAADAFEKITKAIEFLDVAGGIEGIRAKMLPKVKAALMEKLSSQIPEKMIDKAGLQVLCKAIEPSDLHRRRIPLGLTF